MSCSLRYRKCWHPPSEKLEPLLLRECARGFEETVALFVPELAYTPNNRPIKDGPDAGETSCGGGRLNQGQFGVSIARGVTSDKDYDKG